MAHTVESAEERQSAWIHREETGEVPPDRGAVGISSVIECVGMKVSVLFQPEECGICYVRDGNWYNLRFTGAPAAGLRRDLVVF